MEGDQNYTFFLRGINKQRYDVYQKRINIDLCKSDNIDPTTKSISNDVLFDKI